MIAVIPLGPKRPATLPYVARALEQFAGVDQLVTVGHPPEGIEPDLHIDSPNDRKPHLNILGHLRRASDVGDEFIWCDDDTFPIRPWTPGVYVRKYSIAQMLAHYPNRGGWSAAVRASIKLMESQGFDPHQVPAGTVHRPWLVNTKRVMEVVDQVEPVGGSFKASYVVGLESVIPSNEAKIVGRGVPHPEADVISVFNDSWRYNAGRVVRERLTEPSRWESVPTRDMAVSTGGQRAAHRRRHR